MPFYIRVPSLITPVHCITQTGEPKLTELEKEYNKALAKERIIIEHINRKLKIFKILSCKYRNRRRRYSLRVNLLAAIYNCELGIGIAAS